MCVCLCLYAVRPAWYNDDRIGIMLLCEVALGNEHNIDDDNSSLTCAPKGYDSIVARGQNEPGKHDNVLCLFVCRRLLHLKSFVSLLFYSNFYSSVLTLLVGRQKVIQPVTQNQ